MSLFTEGGTMEVHGLRFDVAGVSEQGPRPENQDAFVIDRFAATGMVAVADGMGGERSGRVAADTALAALAAGEPISSLDDARRAVRHADAEVARAAESDPAAHQGMGCALGLLALTRRRDEGALWIGAHVGDVRIISRSPDGAVRLETRDHTPAFARWEAGEISLDEIADTAGANRLQRAVGRGGEADVIWMPARPGWSWMIVSDGVYKAMRLDELAELMAMRSASAACDALRRKVEERGPDDNYTAVLVRALGEPGAGLVAPRTDDRTEPMMHANPGTSRPAGRGVLAPLAILLAVLALALAGYAAWSVTGSATQRAERAELDRLRLTVDSLRAEVLQINEPFGPVAPEDTIAPTGTPLPR